MGTVKSFYTMAEPQKLLLHLKVFLNHSRSHAWMQMSSLETQKSLFYMGYNLMIKYKVQHTRLTLMSLSDR